MKKKRWNYGLVEIPTFLVCKREEILTNGDSLYFQSVESHRRTQQVIIRERAHEIKVR
jgi:hypothetical protein